MLNRRRLMQGIAASTGAALGASLFTERLLASPVLASPVGNTTPKRIVFFMQNQGFDPKTCIPQGMKNSGSLANAKLPDPISALEPYKERRDRVDSKARPKRTRRTGLCSPRFSFLDGPQRNAQRRVRSPGRPPRLPRWWRQHESTARLPAHLRRVSVSH